MFKTILKVAGRNAFLRKTRAILLIVMIGSSMGVMIGLEGLYDGMSQHMIDKSKRSDCGELSLYAPHYRLEHDIAYRIGHAAQKIKVLEEMRGVRIALYRLKVDGLAQTANKSNPAALIGIDLPDEQRFGDFSAFIQDGELDFGGNGALIGSELAKKLKVDVGSRVIFTSQDSQNEIQSIALRIRAIIRTSNVILDDRGIYLPRTRLAHFLSVSSESATQIAVRAPEADPVLLKNNVMRHFPKLEIYTFRELYPQLKQMQELMDAFNGITFAIVMIVVFIGILGVMYVSILDRIREFGILLSIGYAYRYIRWQIMMEAVFLGLTGYLLGVLIGLALLSYLKYHGLDLSIFAEGMAFFGMDSILYATISVSYFVTTFFAILLASVLSVVLPLRKIKKLNPVEVIRSAG